MAARDRTLAFFLSSVMARTLGLLLALCFCCLCRGCRDEERQALLTFKRSLSDEYGVLTNWKGSNCCRWAGVGCSNETDHVVELSIGSLIREYAFECSISSSDLHHSLSALKHLQKLDLMNTCFNQTPIPQFLGSLTTLRYLDLSYTDFVGEIPPQLGNLTALQYLSFYSSDFLRTDSLQWLFPLSTLKYLDLSFVNLTNALDWPLALSKLPSLSLLHLSSCDLRIFPDVASAAHSNISSIKDLDLSTNSFPDSTEVDWMLRNHGSRLVNLDLSSCSMNGPIPHSLGNLTSLKNLTLYANNFSGFIPESFSRLSQLENLDLSFNSLQSIPESLINLCNLQTLLLTENELVGVVSGRRVGRQGCKQQSLEELDLSQNHLTGTFPDWIKRIRYRLKALDLSSNHLTGGIPDWIGQMRNLERLSLYNNAFNGSVPESLGKLSMLVEFDLGFNSLEGVFSDAHFANLTKLEALHLSGNSLILNISIKWVPPFQLTFIDLRSCRMGPQFPPWLLTQTQFYYLDISDAGILDVIPDKFWTVSSGAYFMNLSNNQLTGEIPKSLTFLIAGTIDLSSNLLQGVLPHLNSSVSDILLHDNLFSGDLRPILNEAMSNLHTVTLSGNLLIGEIPVAICNYGDMLVLDVSHNNLSGEIPKCMANTIWSFIIINLARNHLQGPIPHWTISSKQLKVLRLENNRIHGEIPPSLRNCTKVIILDLGENKLTGNIPPWIGENLSSLRFLRLRSNMLTGTIPPQLSYLTNLQVLDLAQNDISGVIPSTFENFTAMTEMNRMVEQIIDIHDHIPLFIPGARSASLFDLGISANFEQVVDVVVKGRQVEYTKTLSLVMVLDLSCNRLSGEIPKELMDLVGLQSLNLSKNQLIGKIPDSFGGMVWLEALDLSRNILSGSIPRSITLLSSLSYLNLSYNNLSGRIPSGNQLQTLLDPSIYAGNHYLCGFPLPKCPGDGPSMDQASWGEDNDDDSDWFDLYLSMGLGYVVGWWIVCGVLLFKNSWRIAYFRFFDDMASKFFEAKETLKRWIILAHDG